MTEKEKMVEVVEETPAETKTPQAFVNEEISDDATNEQLELPALETMRNTFSKMYRKFRIFSYVSTAIVIAVIVVSYVWLLPINQWAGIVPIILVLVASLVYSRWARNKLTDNVRKYMADYNGYVNEYAVSETKVENYVYDFAGQLDKAAFTDARLLKDIINSNSRNLVTYDLGRWHVEIADYAAYRRDGKQARAVFLGKLVIGTTEKEIDGRLVLYIKPSEQKYDGGTGPDDLEDLELVVDKPEYKLYATNKELKKAISTKALEALLQVRPDNELADVSVALYKNKFAVTLTYSDALMVVPYKENVPVHAIKKYKEHLTALNKFIALL